MTTKKNSATDSENVKPASNLLDKKAPEKVPSLLEVCKLMAKCVCIRRVGKEIVSYDFRLSEESYMEFLESIEQEIVKQGGERLQLQKKAAAKLSKAEMTKPAPAESKDK